MKIEASAAPGVGTGATAEEKLYASQSVSSDAINVQFTRLTSTKPQSKTFSLSNAGIIRKQASPQMMTGTAEQVALQFPEGFASTLRAADRCTTFAYGLFDAAKHGAPAKVRMKDSPEVKKGEAIARSRDFFEFAQNQPGIVMLDHDGGTLTPGDLVWILEDTATEVFDGAAYVARASVSAGVHSKGEKPRSPDEPGSHHLYYAVADAGDIPRFGSVLFKRLWLAGQGRIELSAAGTMLLHGPFDAAVFQPERLDFVGAPIVRDGLEYAPPSVTTQQGGMIDTHRLPDLNPIEEASYQRLVDEAKAAKREEAARVRARWRERQLRRMVESGIDEAQAQRSIPSIEDNGQVINLFGDFILDFDKFGAVSVKDVLADVAKYDGQSLADPIEGIAYGTGKAKFYANRDGKPFINSFAHGGCKYFLCALEFENIGEGDEGRDAENVHADDSQTIARLAALPLLEYERVRETNAQCLGVRVSALDKLVAKAREPEADVYEGKGRAIDLYVPEPWPDPVSGVEALTAAFDAIKRHMVIPEHCAVAAALWAAHVHVFEAFSHSPRLLIDAPAAECGKTVQLYHMVGNLVPKPQPVELMKAAPFFRLTEEHQPCWLIDELDAFIKEDSDLLAALNNGWEPHGGVPRCVGDGTSMEVRIFSTWAPVAMAGIKTRKLLPATTVSRSIVIELERAAPGEMDTADIYDAALHRAPLREIGRKLARWTSDNKERIAKARPLFPPGVRNRLADKWTPLLAIADVAGGVWPERARSALLADAPNTPPPALQLLSDIRDAFKGEETSLWTEELIERLSEIDEGPWADYNFRERDSFHRRIQPRQLAKLLHDFNCRPKSIRRGDETHKGYDRATFERAWLRYLPDTPCLSGTPAQSSNHAASSVFPSVTRPDGVPDGKTLEAAPRLICAGVPDKFPPQGRFEDIPGSCTALNQL